MYKTKSYFIVSLLVVMFMVTACTVSIKGSGKLITETRQVSNFDRIVLSGMGEVVVTQGASESLSIETDDNVMKHIKAEVKNGTLTLGFEDGYSLILPSRLVFSVGVDDLTGVSISGSGDVESDRIETGRLDVTVSGSGDVQFTTLTADEVKAMISGSGEISLGGEVAVQDISISGSGKYLAGDVCSPSVKVSVSGSGNATVCATDTLDSNISGSGSVNYYGRPSINSSASGSGTLNNLGEK